VLHAHKSATAQAESRIFFISNKTAGTRNRSQMPAEHTYG
jgi:hypothetical protein